MVCNALLERPDLFAGAIDNVGLTNPTRLEAAQNGATNYDEFGDPGMEEGFRALYAMDAYQHVRDGVAYPAVLINAGMSDARVAPWMGAKFAARLQKASTGGPVLLRVDYDAGHGLGSTRDQVEPCGRTSSPSSGSSDGMQRAPSAAAPTQSAVRTDGEGPAGEGR